MYAARDPWKIIDIRTFLKEGEGFQAERERQRECGDSTTDLQLPLTIARQKRSQRSTHRIRLRSESAKTQLFLPLELILMIMGVLSGSWEMRALMWAFPHWVHEVPQSYWRFQYIKGLLIQGDEQIPGAGDWTGGVLITESTVSILPRTGCEIVGIS
jgi:hypothetical protein